MSLSKRLCSLDREAWAQARAELLAAAPRNKDALSLIEQSLLVICLDDEMCASEDDHCSRLLAAPLGVGNRWFDKICVIVDPKGV